MFDTFFLEYSLIQECYHSQISSVESLLKVIALFKLINRFSENEKNEIILAANRLYFNKVWHLAYSEAQKEATARYNKKAYDRIDLIVPKGKRQIIKDYAKSKGKSANQFINEAIDKAMMEE